MSGLACAARLRSPSAPRETCAGRAESAPESVRSPCSKKKALPSPAARSRVSSCVSSAAMRAAIICTSSGSSRTKSVAAPRPRLSRAASPQPSRPSAVRQHRAEAALRRQRRRTRKRTAGSSRAASAQAARKGAVQGSRKRSESQTAPTTAAASSRTKSPILIVFEAALPPQKLTEASRASPRADQARRSPASRARSARASQIRNAVSYLTDSTHPCAPVYNGTSGALCAPQPDFDAARRVCRTAGGI